MFLMNRFFDGAFLTFGIDVLRFLESDQEDRVDPMIYVFPRMTKCTFYKYGVSGEVERHDAVCILPLNVVNEKIYVFLWFWFLFLGVLSFFTVLYRVSSDARGEPRKYCMVKKNHSSAKRRGKEEKRIEERERIGGGNFSRVTNVLCLTNSYLEHFSLLFRRQNNICAPGESSF